MRNVKAEGAKRMHVTAGLTPLASTAIILLLHIYTPVVAGIICNYDAWWVQEEVEQLVHALVVEERQREANYNKHLEDLAKRKLRDMKRYDEG